MAPDSQLQFQFRVEGFGVCIQGVGFRAIAHDRVYEQVAHDRVREAAVAISERGHEQAVVMRWG